MMCRCAPRLSAVTDIWPTDSGRGKRSGAPLAPGFQRPAVGERPARPTAGLDESSQDTMTQAGAPNCAAVVLAESWRTEPGPRCAVRSSGPIDELRTWGMRRERSRLLRFSLLSRCRPAQSISPATRDCSSWRDVTGGATSGKAGRCLRATACGRTRSGPNHGGRGRLLPARVFCGRASRCTGRASHCTGRCSGAGRVSGMECRAAPRP